MNGSSVAWFIALVMLAGRAEAAPDPVTERLAALRSAAKCGGKETRWRPWCVITDFATGGAAELPKGKVLVGFTIQLQKDKEAGTLAEDQATFAALVIDADGRVKLTALRPRTKAEEPMFAEAVFYSAAVFRRKVEAAAIPKGVADLVQTLKASHPTTKSGDEWTWTDASPSRMRKVGKFWVVMTPQAGNAVVATVLTESWLAVQ